MRGLDGRRAGTREHEVSLALLIVLGCAVMLGTLFLEQDALGGDARRPGDSSGS
jgi:hypothetical protein